MYSGSNASSSVGIGVDLNSVYASQAVFVDSEFASSSSSSNRINQPNQSSTNAPLTHTFEFAPLNGGGGFMFGAHQDALQYRSLLVPRDANSASSSAFNPLVQDGYLARAVDVQQSRSQTNWFAPEQLQQSSLYTTGAFVGYGSTQKLSTFATATQFGGEQFHTKEYRREPAPLKELSMPRLESLLVSVPASLSLELPRMPLFLEATTFSIPSAVCGAPQVFSQIQDAMKQAGTIVAMQKQFQLTCTATVGVSCAEFNVRCYSGHYRSCARTATASNNTDAPAADGSWCTVEFQRRSGCGFGTMQLFKHVVRTLVQVLGESGVDCALALNNSFVDDAGGDASEPGSPAQQSEDDMTDIDMSGLGKPSMVRGPTDVASTLPPTLDCLPTTGQPDVSLYTSLLDLLTSQSEQAQLEGLNSLALCLDGSNPRAGELLIEVARKLRGDSVAQMHVKQVAARLIAQASSMPSVAAQVVKHCLPTLLATLMAGATTDPAESPLAAAHGLDAQKSLLQSCVSLSASIPQALDSEGGIVANSRLKRELLRLTGSESPEVRELAVQTIRSIQV